MQLVLSWENKGLNRWENRPYSTLLMYKFSNPDDKMSHSADLQPTCVVNEGNINPTWPCNGTRFELEVLEGKV